MKKLSLSFIVMFLCLGMSAQRVEYKAFIYTDQSLSDDIQNYLHAEQNQGARFGGMDLLNAGLNAMKGIGAGYITSAVDLGVTALASLITRNARLKAEWEEEIARENKWELKYGTIKEISDFYSTTSKAGALDPVGMKFSGVGCLRTDGPDTLFYISCHIDRDKLYRIVNHSKFELVLDTLIISPARSNLPNSELNLPFSFDERRNFNLRMDIKLTSSWITYQTLVQKDIELGEFAINVPVDKSDLDEDGFLRYYRPEYAPSLYRVVGESFIVPRSYTGSYDGENAEDLWGTGQYSLDITLTETCDITDKMRENWKADRKKRKQMRKKGNLVQQAMKMITQQHWDEITQAWVITTLKAPAQLITSDILNTLGMGAPLSASGASQTINVSKPLDSGQNTSGAQSGVSDSDPSSTSGMPHSQTPPQGSKPSNP